MKTTFRMMAAAAVLAAAQDTFARIGSGLAGTYPAVDAKIAGLIDANIEGVHATTSPRAPAIPTTAFAGGRTRRPRSPSRRRRAIPPAAPPGLPAPPEARSLRSSSPP